MNDKTLKIRIKLHSAGTSSESPSADSDGHERRTSAPPPLEKGSPKRFPRLAGLLGLGILLLAGAYVFNTKETNDPLKLASSTNLDVEKSLLTSNESSPGKVPQNTAVNQGVMELDEGLAQAPQGTDDRPTTIELTDSKNIEPESRANPAESASLELSSDDPTAQVVTGSLGSNPSTEPPGALTPPTPHTEYATIEATAQNEAESSPPGRYAATASGLNENVPTFATESISSEGEAVPKALSETQSKSNHIDSHASQLPRVSRAHFTSGMEAREPIDRVNKIFHSEGQKIKRLYYFTELHGMKGDSIIHRWDHQGRTVANITFNISGDRWRVYSSKNLLSSMKGRWNVVVTDSSGKPLVSDSFIYD